VVDRPELQDMRDIALDRETLFTTRYVNVLGEREEMNLFRGRRLENALTGTPLNFRHEDSDCIRVYTQHLVGEGITDDSGVWTLKLLDVVCGYNGPPYAPWPLPPYLLATPHTPQPRFLTTGFTADVNNLRNYTIEVRSWLTSGSPASRVAFSWYCIVLLFSELG
jgi:hypothetical protein